MQVLILHSYIANLVISVNPEINEFEGRDKNLFNQLISLLRPFNGTAYCRYRNQQYGQFKGLIEQQDIKGIFI